MEKTYYINGLIEKKRRESYVDAKISADQAELII